MTQIPEHLQPENKTAEERAAMTDSERQAWESREIQKSLARSDLYYQNE